MRQRRILAVLVVALCAFTGLWLHLARLQFIEHRVWAAEAERSLATFETLPFERGWILDRHGEPLARTEEARDLHFRFRDWRQKQGSVVGHVLSLLWLLDGERREVGQVSARVAELLADVGAVTVAELGAMEPRQRRADALTYLGWIYGPSFDGALRTALAAGGDPWLRLGELAGFETGRASAVLRASRQAAALADLARALGSGPAALHEELDRVVRRSDERVLVSLQAGAATARVPAVRAVVEGFRRLRDRHAEVDAEPVRLFGNVSHDVQTLVAVRAADLPGFLVRTETRRTYPARWQDTAPLLVGRVGSPRAAGAGGEPGDLELAAGNRRRLSALAALEDPTDEEQAEYDRLRIVVREIDYRATEERGLFGLEAALEPLLRGKRGWVASGASRGESRPPQRGLNVTLTLDVELQAAAEAVLDEVLAGAVFRDAQGRPEGWPGAIVLLDPRTGHVLALASAPRPRRDDLVRRYGELLADPTGPLHDRALGPGDSGNLPPPGSTFKPLVALAALGSGRLAAGQRFDCHGRLPIGTTTLRCTGYHPAADLTTALARSCNIWFYRLAAQVGGETVMSAARSFGYGEPSGLLQNEVLAERGIRLHGGVVERHVPLSERDPSGTEAMRTAIGQALLDDVTPLAVAAALGAVGHGEFVPPTLLAAIEGFGALPPRPARGLGARPQDLAAVRRGLVEAVRSGTAARLADELAAACARRRAAAPDAPLPDPEALARLVAGKTGTAQVAGTPRRGGWLEERLARRPELRDPSGLLPDHSWFAGYLPAERPELAFAILLEHSGRHGGDAGVPVAARLFTEPALVRRFAEAARP